MSKSKHTEAELIGALKQLEAGRKEEDRGTGSAREVGVSKHTIYAWKGRVALVSCDKNRRVALVSAARITLVVSTAQRKRGCPTSRGFRDVGMWRIEEAPRADCERAVCPRGK
jgi:hypothetical protein